MKQKNLYIAKLFAVEVAAFKFNACDHVEEGGVNVEGGDVHVEEGCVHVEEDDVHIVEGYDNVEEGGVHVAEGCVHVVEGDDHAEDGVRGVRYCFPSYQRFRSKKKYIINFVSYFDVLPHSFGELIKSMILSGTNEGFYDEKKGS